MALSEVKLGLVGTEAATASRAMEALRRQPRLRLTEVFDPCLASAQAHAQSSDVDFSPSLDGLLRRTDGIIIADVRWMGPEPIVRAAGLQRPALILSPVFTQFSMPDLKRLQHFSELTQTLMMPELSYRWTRSTLRLRELTATRLQNIEEIDLDCQCHPGSSEELMIFDWCTNVVQSECLDVLTNAAGTEIELQYRRQQTSANHPVTIRLHLDPPADGIPAPPFPITEANIRCRAGQALISGEVDLVWKLATGPEQTESLNSDRTSEDVMYGLFGRRLVGGLVPVPDIADLIRASAIRAAKQLSQAQHMDDSE